MSDQQENGLAVRYRLLLAACADVRLKPADTRVLSVVLGLMKKDQEYAWPSLKFIGDKSGLDRRTVTRSIGALVDLGYLVRESGDARTANVYRPGVPGGDGEDAPTGEDAARGEQAPRGDSVQGVGADSSTSVGAATPLYKGLKAVEEKAVDKTPSLAALAPAPGNKTIVPEPTKPKKPPKPKPEPDLADVELPPWLPAQAWADFVEHRREIRRKVKPTAATKLIAKLGRFRDDGYDPVALLDNAIANGWQGIFVPKDFPKGPQTTAPRTRREQLQHQLSSARTAADRLEINAQLCALGDDDGDAIEGDFRPVPTGPGYLPRDPRSDEELLAEMEAAERRMRGEPLELAP